MFVGVVLRCVKWLDSIVANDRMLADVVRAVVTITVKARSLGKPELTTARFR